ncbi:uncharacterized protein LOC131605971 [Vicia villosa]|uniref:uncharacterized protein LOC131605971 n=1 Tax=Vicia villosa TaxID=3911 RepID=UPI00273C50B6|nr:uncharacterized protein LOC131605971 [Vicia villosa]
MSLMERFFKGRCYSRRSIAEAGLGFKPSYAWRSILSSKDVVLKGSRWRIGNGEQMKIWSDNWIPSLPGFKPLNPIVPIVPGALASSLIDGDLGCWKLHTLKESFGDGDVSHIASIPLSKELLDDKLIWNAEKNREFSAKTSYHLLGAARRFNMPGPSTSVDDGFWKLLWKAPIVNKVKEFLWRLVKNILPLRSNVCKKGIVLDPSCPLCYCDAESSSHLFLHYDFTKRMFFSPPLGVRIPDVDEVMDWLLLIFRNKDVKLCQVVCMGLWKVWKARNSVVFDKGVPCYMLFAKDVWLSSIEEDSSMLVSTDRVVPSKVEVSCGNSWIIQTDVGCFDGGIVSLGCVIRSANAEVLLETTQRLTSFVTPGTAEALGIRWGLQLADDLKLDKVVLQSDALGVVDYVNGVISVPDLDPIVMDCRSLRSFLISSTVMFIGRDVNTDAHSLVGIGKSVDSRTWLGAIPCGEKSPVISANLAFY